MNDSFAFETLDGTTLVLNPYGSGTDGRCGVQSNASLTTFHTKRSSQALTMVASARTITFGREL
jgi:hypothetical protein